MKNVAPRRMPLRRKTYVDVRAWKCFMMRSRLKYLNEECSTEKDAAGHTWMSTLGNAA